MIEIIVSSKVYTKEELMDEFRRYSDNADDFDLFIAAMISTKQLTKREGGYHPTTTTVTSEVKEVDQYRVYNAQKHGGVAKSKKGNYQRIAVAGKTWSKKTDPTNMYISAYYDKKTKEFLPIKERVPLIGPGKPPVKPRKGERWRANIPADVVRQYKLKPDTPIRVRVLEVTPTYYGTLTLWGYKIGGMIAFGQTSKHKEDRKIEIRADNFNMETDGAIKNDIDTAGTKIISTIQEWLRVYDIQYYDFLNRCTGIKTEAPPHEGEYIEPISISPGKQLSTMEFQDKDNKDKPGAVVYTAKLPFNWIDKDASNLASSFYLVGQDYVVHGYKARDVKHKKKVKTEKGKTVTVTKESKPYSLRQTQLFEENKPGFGGKKK